MVGQEIVIVVKLQLEYLLTGSTKHRAGLADKYIYSLVWPEVFKLNRLRQTLNALTTLELSSSAT